MKISLIGMSGAGKSYWARQLEKSGWKRYSCDDHIESALKKNLHILESQGTQGLAEWMGKPYEIQYAQTSKKYLALENQVMHDILNDIETHTNENIVIDTTGSIIYTDPMIQQRLKNITNVLYLLAPKTAVQKLYDQYVQDPKPIIWGNAYQKRQDESDEEALLRCYKNLLLYRIEKYQELAYFSIRYDVLREKDFSVESFINLMYCV